jgi:hypothetical protein
MPESIRKWISKTRKETSNLRAGQTLTRTTPSSSTTSLHAATQTTSGLDLEEPESAPFKGDGPENATSSIVSDSLRDTEHELTNSTRASSVCDGGDGGGDEQSMSKTGPQPLRRMKAWWRDMRKGDTIVYNRLPGADSDSDDEGDGSRGGEDGWEKDDGGGDGGETEGLLRSSGEARGPSLNSQRNQDLSDGQSTPKSTAATLSKESENLLEKMDEGDDEGLEKPNLEPQGILEPAIQRVKTILENPRFIKFPFAFKLHIWMSHLIMGGGMVSK